MEVHLYECGTGAGSYEGLGQLSRALMKFQAGAGPLNAPNRRTAQTLGANPLGHTKGHLVHRNLVSRSSCDSRLVILWLVHSLKGSSSDALNFRVPLAVASSY